MNQFLKFRVQLLIAFDFLVLQANDKKLDDVHFNLCMKCIDNTTVCGNEILRQKFKQRLETYCFCSVSYYYYYSSSFFPLDMNMSTTDFRNYWTEFHETLWSHRYMFLVDPKVFRFVVKGVKAIFLGVQRGWRLL
jgi:hypothetical protein